MEFVKMAKIPRLNRECIITEKIDGTNGQIVITEEGQCLAGSRNRWIMPGKQTDNYGFAQWVEDNQEFLVATLGPGRHYGEWYGRGIARHYDLEERRFSLFHTREIPENDIGLETVPVLYWTAPNMQDTTFLCTQALQGLYDFGSVAAPGFMSPEGIVLFHKASRYLFKVTLENDEKPKGSHE
jgi:RNA ligase